MLHDASGAYSYVFTYVAISNLVTNVRGKRSWYCQVLSVSYSHYLGIIDSR